MNSTVVRSLSGIVFLAVMVMAILLNQNTFILLTTTIIVLGMLEFYRLTVPKAKPVQLVMGVLCGVLLNLGIFLGLVDYGLAITAFPLAIALISLLFIGIFISGLYCRVEKPFEQLSYLITGIFYIALPFATASLFVLHFGGGGIIRGTYNGWPLLGYFILLWANDVGAYCFGITLGKHGKHKLFPRHSPKKSWEGFIGGVLMAMLAGYLLTILVFDHHSVLGWIAMGFVVSIFATFGDLVESMLKRSAGVKDSGSIMPGHGGILDRFDGVLLSIIPAFFIYILFIR